MCSRSEDREPSVARRQRALSRLAISSFSQSSLPAGNSHSYQSITFLQASSSGSQRVASLSLPASFAGPYPVGPTTRVSGATWPLKAVHHVTESAARISALSSVAGFRPYHSRRATEADTHIHCGDAPATPGSILGPGAPALWRLRGASSLLASTRRRGNDWTENRRRGPTGLRSGSGCFPISSGSSCRSSDRGGPRSYGPRSHNVRLVDLHRWARRIPSRRSIVHRTCGLGRLGALHRAARVEARRRAGVLRVAVGEERPSVRPKRTG